MRRPWKIWVAFGLCSVVMLAVMAWISQAAFRLERARTQAEQQAEAEESIRLALWRMDSMLAPVIAQENSRPYFTYNAFYAAERAYGKMFNPLAKGEVLVPSPLLNQVSTNILLHFQFDPEGLLSSPQVPESNQRDLAEAQFTTHDRIEEAMRRLNDFREIMAQQTSAEFTDLNVLSSRAKANFESNDSNTAMASGQRSTQLQSSAQTLRPNNRSVLLSAAPTPIVGTNLLPMEGTPLGNAPAQERLRAQKIIPSSPKDSLQKQMAKNDGEMKARVDLVRQNFDLNLKNAYVNYRPSPNTDLAASLIKPLWLGDTLVLVRRVIVQNQEFVQGCWLDWPGMQQWLLEGVLDLLPNARLEPLRGNPADPQARMLASLPIRLVPATMSVVNSGSLSPTMAGLILAWICLIAAVTVAAVLLHGTVSLSERRAAFVSAVTHELRTPLTTFKMYSEMLAGDMVQGAPKRQEYVQTLCSEADRLGHLIENVLAYAQLERGSSKNRVESISLPDLLARIKPRLAQRAEQSQMTLRDESDKTTLETIVRVDIMAVEQILFNLVDNACKYGSTQTESKIIHLVASFEASKGARVIVRDHGPGISARGARRLFKPFSKSAHEAARTAPGVGLGLALSRRLSRSLGGDLRLVSSPGKGACFELRLPILAPGIS